ncbi:3-carboxyethylcatechol 2,3-dioxygenase [Frankia sp. CNm7]|uniref:2,3-dihydroxyphenylpropionate/2,3-dihydroxicinnamic acid 1,2-dioxygenase n=1 Tax=Frankia nepalensis TaxID=1836974 RepID=A0A937R7Y8_9ACTN|nr:3-carboxyethylcatechol 2,3-dioxygenase [Frankia nepalensis]MBL7500849.1 3-carboxyethylcatechol 2,3-dioxygenase [Frankia nepalensis]MBL7509215.1 3-carboxyethylcatechol 2,3-dioxygenase [Frankia nepalensis]MBL7519484.1 3-carboxyethylcatechol 2,3-dioxygenase [Frankia nepalensis]MBL7627021.1 3-carboxyethylcatechol 2,3-dioxygenase [Frankia nepalensis]
MPLALCCMSHSPLLDITEQSPELEADVRAALSAARAFAEDFAPDVVVVFAPDHFNGFFYRLMPPFCVGMAATTVGDYGSLAGTLHVPTGLAQACAQAVLADGVDLSISHRMKLDHSSAQPLRELFGALDARPVIPVFINAAAAPLGPLARTRQLGAAIGRFFGRRDERVLLVGSGGLSHDPPVPTLDSAPAAMAERLVSGRPLTIEEAARKHTGAIAEGLRLADGSSERRPLSPAWDTEFLSLVTSGALTELDGWSNDEIGQHGSGAHEIRAWIAAYSALDAAGPYEATYRYYRPIPEYIAGFAVTTARPGGADN